MSVITAPLLAMLLIVATSPVGSSSHGDGNYDVPNWFEWNADTLDILIIPPEHGQIFNGNGVLNGLQPTELTPFNTYLAATVDSVNDWKNAIALFGSPWLTGGLTLNVYVVGIDTIPIPALTNPDVVIASDETKANILGVAIHLAPRCLVLNSKFFTTSFTYADMYNINGQEFGHCLGVNHVVDGHPTHDVMNGSYPHSPGAAGTHLHCISNLDVKGVESAFADWFEQPGGGANGVVPVGSYAQTAC